MRVVAGTCKGFELRGPKGFGTRPTSDKARDAIFNVLGDTVAGASVLDLYAGTGALSIEALSRGANHAVLVESSRDACNVIRANLSKTRLEDSATVWCLPVARSLTRLGRRFDLVLLDPPYDAAGVDAVMEALGTGRLLLEGAWVVLEHGKRDPSLSQYGALTRRQVKRYGDTSVSFYTCASPAQPEISTSVTEGNA